MPIAWIETIDEEDAGEELEALYARVKGPGDAAVDNVLAVHSLHPQGLAAHYDVYRAAMDGTRALHRVDREMIAFVVSSVNGCHY